MSEQALCEAIDINVVQQFIYSHTAGEFYAVIE